MDDEAKRLNFHAKRLIDEPQRVKSQAKRVEFHAKRLNVEPKRLVFQAKRLVLKLNGSFAKLFETGQRIQE